MNAPDKIYLHPDIGGREFIRPWLHKAANSESVVYIRKDTLLEKIDGQIRICKELKAEGRGDVFYTTEIDAFEQTKRIIESL